MKYLSKSAMLAVMLASAFGATSTAYASEESAETASPHTLTTNIGLFTDYTFRGISYTKERGAVQGGIDYSHSSGFFLGVWATNIENNAFYGNSSELDIYGGYTHQLSDDLSLTGGFIQYFFPGSNHPIGLNGNKGDSPNNFEFNAAVTYKYFTLKHSASVTDYFGTDFGDGSSRGSGYTELNVNYKLPVADLNLVAHVGRLHVRNYSEYNYTDWLVGVNKDFSILGSKGWNTGVNYTTTNADDNVYVDAKGWEVGNDRFIGYIKRTF